MTLEQEPAQVSFFTIKKVLNEMKYSGFWRSAVKLVYDHS